MRNELFKFSVSRAFIIIFWLIVIGIFAGIYFFAPSVFNQMRNVSYQNTPYVNTPNTSD